MTIQVYPLRDGFELVIERDSFRDMIDPNDLATCIPYERVIRRGWITGCLQAIDMMVKEGTVHSVGQSWRTPGEWEGYYTEEVTDPARRAELVAEAEHNYSQQSQNYGTRYDTWGNQYTYSEDVYRNHRYEDYVTWNAVYQERSARLRDLWSGSY